VSFDLIVIAAPPGADEAAARAVLEHCFPGNGTHREGELDERIAGFYADLRANYPDLPPYDDNTPWSVMPLDTGIDHVVMNLRWSADDDVIDLIQQLATRHGLVLYDCQDGMVYLPPE
jgi:hypothetical protein